MSIYYLWHGNNEEEHLLLMAHKGVRPCNLFINGALSPDHHNSTGRVIHQRWALTQRRWMHFPVLTWMLDNSKLAQGAARGLGYRVGCQRQKFLPCFLPHRMSACMRARPRLWQGNTAYASVESWFVCPQMQLRLVIFPYEQCSLLVPAGLGH